MTTLAITVGDAVVENIVSQTSNASMMTSMTSMAFLGEPAMKTIALMATIQTIQKRNFSPDVAEVVPVAASEVIAFTKSPMIRTVSWGTLAVADQPLVSLLLHLAVPLAVLAVTELLEEAPVHLPNFHYQPLTRVRDGDL